MLLVPMMDVTAKYLTETQPPLQIALPASASRWFSRC